MGHTFLVLREANGQMLPSTLNQTGFTPSQDGILGNEVGHAQEREHCLPSLSIPKLSGPEDPTRAG